MKDKLDQVLEIGDSVTFVRPHGHRDMVVGKIIAFTPKKIRVEYIDSLNTLDTLIDPLKVTRIHGFS